ncbi:hypothetical protein KM043_007981 [Ampulex compressa]|nr:hypothetical protein KM043_007981 [Ampulex compressa]
MQIDREKICDYTSGGDKKLETNGRNFAQLWAAKSGEKWLESGSTSDYVCRTGGRLLEAAHGKWKKVIDVPAKSDSPIREGDHNQDRWNCRNVVRPGSVALNEKRVRHPGICLPAS